MTKSMLYLRFLLILTIPCLPVTLFGAKPVVTNLICEYQSNPLGIDVKSPRLSWQIHTDKQNLMQSAYEIRVVESSGALHHQSKLAWNSGKINSDQSVNVEYKGLPLKSRTRYYWQVRVWGSNGKATGWSEPAFWETALLDPSLWKAEWIAAKGKNSDDHRPVCFRKEFSCPKKIQSARIYISSLGLYDVRLNGEKITADLFTPGWTSYNKRIQYQTYDVTALLKSENALGVVVGDGWFRGNVGGKVKNNYYGDRSAVIAQLEIIYSDGTTAEIVTDETWRTANGAIIESDIYNGETYDARLENAEWDRPGFAAGSFVPAVLLDHPKNILVASVSYPVRAITEIKPIKIIRTPKGETVYDMGQNMVGWVRLKVKGKPGEHVVMKFAEVLDKEGNFYTDNLRSAKATDEYILKGGEAETYEPHFTFHGFRFVKLEQFPGTPDLNTVTGIVIHSDMPPTGSFTSSDSLINRLQHNIQWGQKGNFLDIPTDCPQRNERLGWTGDAQVFAPTAAFNFNVAPFFTKWMLDLAADQLSDGKVPDVIPDVRSGRGSSAAWGDAAVVVPWTVYLAYGDTRILEIQYASMKSWVGYMHQRAGEKHLWTGDNHYGDWLAYASTDSDYPGATTDMDLIATAYDAYSTKRLAEIARILGKQEDAANYEKTAQDIKAAFIREFVTPAGRLTSNTQTAYSLALAFDLMPDSLVSKAAGYLAQDVRKMGHLTTGFVGTPLLCQALSDHGHADLAFKLLMRKEYPSWLYPVTQGATTIWERWDGQKPDGTFQDASMNSFNHYAYGAIGEWLYSYIAGLVIDPENPGYKHFFLQPHPGGGLTSASASLNTLYGTILSEWKIENGSMEYTCMIPPNTSATVCFDAAVKNISLNNSPLLNHGSVSCKEDNGRVRISLSSGQYRFAFLLQGASAGAHLK